MQLLIVTVAWARAATAAVILFLSVGFPTSRYPRTCLVGYGPLTLSCRPGNTNSDQDPGGYVIVLGLELDGAPKTHVRYDGYEGVGCGRVKGEGKEKLMFPIRVSLYISCARITAGAGA